jgi:hypothetical protein
MSTLGAQTALYAEDRGLQVPMALEHGPVTSSGKAAPGPDPRIRHRTQIGMFRPIRMDHTNCLQVAIKTLQFNSKLDIINNERYTVKKIDIDTRHLTIQNDRNEIVIHAENFQKLFRIGYAFTTHSSQGMSIDKPYTIHEFNRMSKKLKYVALSRSTKHEYINIM